MEPTTFLRPAWGHWAVNTEEGDHTRLNLRSRKLRGGSRNCTGLKSVPKIQVHPEPQDVTLFGNWTLTDVISEDEVILEWNGT